MSRCVIISGGEIQDHGWLKEQIKADDYIICADSGFAHAKKANITPHLILGDFDSYTGKLPESVETLFLPAEKDDTDTQYAAKEGLIRGYQDFALYGMLGGRPDHSYANYCSLYHIYKQTGSTGTAVIYSEAVSIQFLENGALDLDKQDDTYVSLLPFGGKASGVTLTGFEYPLHKATLTMTQPTGISNRQKESRTRIYVESGALLVMIVRDCF